MRESETFSYGWSGFTRMLYGGINIALKALITTLFSAVVPQLILLLALLFIRFGLANWMKR